jgi:hypothetical protein
MDENQVIETPAPVAEVSEVSEPTMQSFTADDLAKARAQEKQKLYPQMEKMQEELAKAKALAEDLAAKEEQREAERNAKTAERAAKKKQEEEQELTFKELLSKKEQEFQSQLDAERLEREKAFALLDRERQFQDLMSYRAQRIEQERDTIVPQLIDLVSGNTQDEIEQSIATLKDKSAGIMQDVQQATANAKQQMVGARVTAPASGPLDNNSEQQSYTPDSIRDMSLADYAKQRAKLLGTAASNRGQGLFG